MGDLDVANVRWSGRGDPSGSETHHHKLISASKQVVACVIGSSSNCNDVGGGSRSQQSSLGHLITSDLKSPTAVDLDEYVLLILFCFCASGRSWVAVFFGVSWLA